MMKKQGLWRTTMRLLPSMKQELLLEGEEPRSLLPQQQIRAEEL